MDAKVCIGMFLYNEQRHIRQAIESLLGQTSRDFRLIILNDCSTDDTEGIVQEYARSDSRIAYLSNPQRMGYAANYRITFQHAPADVTYFAWAAGHDFHHPRWLETLQRVLDDHPEVVMAYPLTARVGDANENLHVPSPRFETFGMTVPERIAALHYQGVGFGNMIYGLFRADALRQAGVFRSYLVPDIMLLWELSLRGAFRQVDEELWYRRYVGLFSVERQRRNVFARPPWYAYLPWPLVNSAALAWNTAIAAGRGRPYPRRAGFALAYHHLAKYMEFMERDAPRSSRVILPLYRALESTRAVLQRRGAA